MAVYEVRSTSRDGREEISCRGARADCWRVALGLSRQTDPVGRYYGEAPRYERVELWHVGADRPVFALDSLAMSALAAERLEDRDARA